jgi:hypothetical protein
MDTQNELSTLSALQTESNDCIVNLLPDEVSNIEYFDVF